MLPSFKIFGIICFVSLFTGCTPVKISTKNSNFKGCMIDWTLFKHSGLEAKYAAHSIKEKPLQNGYTDNSIKLISYLVDGDFECADKNNYKECSLWRSYNQHIDDMSNEVHSF